MVFSHFDHQMMSRAMTLARQGRFTTPPNPNVGCVVTQGQRILGEGYHAKAGQGHAEVNALAQVSDAQGATVYVTLEPCSHYGKTPPCADALIQAKVARVVCAMSDPNPHVSGRGIQKLRDAGIQVEVGLLAEEAEALNVGFLHKMRTGRPFVQLKMAMSFDGKTALANGKSQWITSSAARQDVQVFRAQACAILSTAKTVMADNASLNVRWADLPVDLQSQYPHTDLRQPLRVILDSQQCLKEHAELHLFQTQGERVILDKHSPCWDQEQGFLLSPLLTTLAETYAIHRLWVEAGATLATRFIQQGLVDELILYIAPKLMGDDARGLTQLLGITSMKSVKDLTIKDMRMVGQDIRIIATFAPNK